MTRDDPTFLVAVYDFRTVIAIATNIYTEYQKNATDFTFLFYLLNLCFAFSSFPPQFFVGFYLFFVPLVKCPLGRVKEEITEFSLDGENHGQPTLPVGYFILLPMTWDQLWKKSVGEREEKEKSLHSKVFISRTLWTQKGKCLYQHVFVWKKKRKVAEKNEDMNRQGGREHTVSKNIQETFRCVNRRKRKKRKKMNICVGRHVKPKNSSRLKRHFYS